MVATVADGPLARTLGRIDQILADGRDHLSTPEPDQWKALSLTRWEMLRSLNLLFELKREWIEAQADEGLDARGTVDNLDLLQSYEAFVEHWALNNPSSVHDDYKAEALRMAERIERQIVADRAALLGSELN